jgi:hypothetical protein
MSPSALNCEIAYNDGHVTPTLGISLDTANRCSVCSPSARASLLKGLGEDP